MSQATNDSRCDILRHDHIVETIERLESRIGDRFPESGLQKLCGRLLDVSRQSSATSLRINRPILTIRWFGYLLAVGFVCLLVGLVTAALRSFRLDAGDLSVADLIQTLDAGISAMIFIAAAIFFLIKLEDRIKRNRALRAIHDLRSMAHVVDVHQLTKDPERVLPSYRGTKNSPKTTMTPLQLNRYLDYCTEMLSLIGKIAALYITRFDDPVAVAAASEVEQLTTGLSRKIWQKLVTLRENSFVEESTGTATTATAKHVSTEQKETA